MTTAIILAALAALYLATRPAAPAGLPPLVAPPAVPAAPAATGPHPLTLLAILAAGGMIAFAILESRMPAPAPAPAPATALDLRGKFVGAEAAGDAAITAEIMAALADAITYDATLPEPRLRTGQAFAELRTAAREYRTGGVRLGDRQPLARDAIAAHLEQAVGTDGGPVDAAGRERWVRAFREVAAAARAAIGR